jgi:serine/threonine-protein kinase
MSLSPGTRLGAYEIVARIGTGGMGEVWKARDTRLNRHVAIKRLIAQHSERFEQEARAVAALSHPNICQIHDVGPDYLVFEYVDGAPLAGPVPPREALRLALQVANALEAAHRRGILHRDLKPANILVARGDLDQPAVKLLDFGLAKLFDSDVDATRTIDGAVIGTAAYMSPEQAEGRPTDARSDIFSFGAVLHELISGRRAFGGTTTMQVLAAVMREEPPLVDAPPVVSEIVRRCLEKRPENRFQSVAELKASLERAAQSLAPRGAAADAKPSIAVLPFANLSADKDNEYFSDGLAEEIINLLAHMPGLTVIARTSAFAFKGKQEDIRRIAEALGVTTVLEGSVRRSGNRIRVTAQLITASNGGHLWSERYDRELTDVFAIQDEIAQAIARALEVKLALEPATKRGGTSNLAAYEAYLKSRYYWSRLTPDSMARSREYCEEAIRLDPQFALAHCHLGELSFVKGMLGIPDGYRRAREAAERVLRLDPSLSEAQALLGSIAGLYDLDWAEGANWFRLATAHERVPPHTRMHYGYHLLLTGHLDAARAEYERALAEDPLNPLYREHMALYFATTRDYGRSKAELRKILELDDHVPYSHFRLALIGLQEGNVSEALASAERASAVVRNSALFSGLLAGLLARTGDIVRSELLFATLQPVDAPGLPMAFVLYHLARQQLDQASDWLEKAIEQRHVQAFVLMRAGYFSGTPRRDALMRMLKLPVGES